MHELQCPSCSTPSQFELSDYLLICPFCSSSFKIDMETGQKEIFSDHYIVPNTVDSRAVKGLVIEWLKRLHHKPSQAQKEFFIVDIQGGSLPYWVISLEGHTVWKGLVKRSQKHQLDYSKGADYLSETGQFRRNYRWAVSARRNICELWGVTRLHEPREDVLIEWDGFPLDSTFSRGRLLEAAADQNAYDVREFFEFKFANGLPIYGVQIDEEEALRRAKNHVELYHYKLAKLHVDYLVDYRTELEIAGVQLIHLPFWFASYLYRPKTSLKYFYKQKDKRVIINGFGQGILKGELAIIHRDKVWVNAAVCLVSTVFFVLMGVAWHSAFYFVAGFSAVVGAASAYIATTKANKKILDGEEVIDGGLGFLSRASDDETKKPAEAAA